MSPTAETQVLQANATFTNNMYQILSQHEGNIFFSPLSLHCALSILHQGAQGPTAQALSQTLNVDHQSTTAGYKNVMGRLNSLKDVSLVVANKIYSDKGKTKFAKEFQNCVIQNFASEVEALDLENCKAAAEVVNKWVEGKTQKKIKNIINESVLRKDLGLLLVNALYFKGQWVSKFKESSTRNAQFFVTKNIPIEVKMMHQKNEFRYKQDDELGAQVIELPYKGCQVGMTIILPFEDKNIKDLEMKLAKTRIEKLHEGFKLVDVHLYLPRFKIEETMKLNDTLSQMGLKNIFDLKEADFGKMIDPDNAQQSLYVSDVIQKTYIEVDESGTVAAAASCSGHVLGCAPGAPPPVIFKINRPAIFMLSASHDDARSILFFGRLSQPKI